MIIAPDAAVRSGGGAGISDRRVVEVDRVLAETAPVDERPARQAEQDDRRPDQPDRGVDLARGLERGGVLGCRRGIDLLERHVEGGVEVGRAEVREHVVVEDRLALGVREVGRLEPGRGVQLDLAVFEARVHVEEDDHAVVEARPPDAPLVDQCAGLGLGLLGRQAVRAAVLRVDDDLGAGPRLDLVDRRLGRDDRLRAEDAGLVVDGAVGLGVRERRAGRGPGRAIRSPPASALERAADDLCECRRGPPRRASPPWSSGSMSVSKMPWRSGWLTREAGACIELDLPVLEARVEVEQDDEPVVDAGPPDAPLVHQGGGMGLGLLGRDVVATAAWV